MEYNFEEKLAKLGSYPMQAPNVTALDFSVEYKAVSSVTAASTSQTANSDTSATTIETVN
jgi:hypothetical protein